MMVKLNLIIIFFYILEDGKYYKNMKAKPMDEYRLQKLISYHEKLSQWPKLWHNNTKFGFSNCILNSDIMAVAEVNNNADK